MNVIQSIHVDKNEALTLLEDLVKIDSVNPSLYPGGSGESRIACFIGDYLKKTGFRVEYQHIAKNRVNVIGILPGSGGGKSLMLNGHTDTVSIDGMEIEPFAPKLENGRIYGRGTLDMKGGVTSMIMAARSIYDAGIQLKGDIILALVADEEYASAGTDTLVSEYSADAAIIAEPTELKITIAHKGFAWARIEIFGKAAHGSRPNEGIDAIVKAGKVLNALETLSHNFLPQKKHPLLGSPSIHASLITGGTELSTYPDYCKIELERRTIPGEDKNTVVNELDNLLESLRTQDNQFIAKSDVFFYRPHLEISPDCRVVQCLDQAFQRIFDQEPAYVGESYWMDSALLAGAGIPTVIFGPSGQGAHAAVEYVDFDSVIQTAEVLAHTCILFCS